jgi:hypothetical protein
LLFAVFVTGFAFVVTDERVDDELDGVKFGELDDEDDGEEEVDEGPELIEEL